MTIIDPKLLARTWVHAHEADHDGLLVFRPLGTAMPPSRGRRVIDLADANARIVAPSADDRPTASAVSWYVKDDQLHIVQSATSEQRFQVAALDATELVMKRVD
ncbi:MAG: hypothetical protein ACRDAM_12995 [Casimicrobium sp.]